MTIDTIHIDLPFSNIPNLIIKKSVIDEVTGEVLFSNGYIDSIKVRKNAIGVRIEFSLSKLLKNNNVFPLSNEETVEALLKIEKLLGISIREGIIRRIDFFVNIVTNYKPETYFRYLGESKYYTRFIVGKTSLYYKNENREIILYDKIREMKNKQTEIPSSFYGENILRLECKYKNTFLKKLFKEPLQVNKLLTQECLHFFNEQLWKEYSAIFKEKKFIFNPNSLRTKKDALNQLALKGIESLGGVNQVLETIDASRTDSTIPPEYYSRRKKEIKDLSNLKNHLSQEDYIVELNNKIREECNKYSTSTFL